MVIIPVSELSLVMSPKPLHRIPLRTQVANRMRAELLAKHRPGDRLPTEIQLVKQYGVSLVTVKEALSVLAHERLIERHQGRGTFVRDPGNAPTSAVPVSPGLARVALASGLSPERFNTSTYFLPLLSRIGFHLQSVGIGTRLYLELGNPAAHDPATGFFADLAGGLIRGVVGAGLTPQAQLITTVQAAGIPLVTNDPGRDEAISTDMHALHREGLAQLARRGRRRIGMLSPGGEHLDDTGLPAGAQLNQITPASFSVSDNAEAVASLLKQDPRLDALMLCDDFYLPGALVALARHNLQTPDDVLLCVHHNQGAPDPQFPCLLAEIDIEAMAMACAARMQKLLTGTSAPIIRASIPGRIRVLGGV